MRAKISFTQGHRIEFERIYQTRILWYIKYAYVYSILVMEEQSTLTETAVFCALLC